MELIIFSLISYLIGSISFALVIGKGFYNTDVREHGSGNLGGTNTGRVLGKKAGLSVMTLDFLKVTLVVFLAVRFCTHPWAVACGGVSAALGHCYPVFTKFRGGKAVANLYGFLFGLWTCAGYSPLTYFVPFAVFFMVLYLFKIVSLASMVSAAAAAAYVCFTGTDSSVMFAVVLLAVLILVRHRSNIQRILKGTESKIRWM